MSIVEGSAIKHVQLLGMDCKCEERTVYNGDVYGAYCDFYGQSYKWCYLSGGKNGASCPGAVLSIDSSNEPFYWTKDEGVCAGISKKNYFYNMAVFTRSSFTQCK